MNIENLKKCNELDEAINNYKLIIETPEDNRQSLFGLASRLAPEVSEHILKSAADEIRKKVSELKIIAEKEFSEL